MVVPRIQLDADNSVTIYKSVVDAVDGGIALRVKSCLGKQKRSPPVRCGGKMSVIRVLFFTRKLMWWRLSRALAENRCHDWCFIFAYLGVVGKRRDFL